MKKLIMFLLAIGLILFFTRSGAEGAYWRIETADGQQTGYLLANAYQCRVPGSAPAAATDYLEGLTFAG